jgi:hypothetical protein
MTPNGYPIERGFRASFFDTCNKAVAGANAQHHAETGASVFEAALPRLATRLMRTKREPCYSGALWVHWPYCFHPIQAGGREHVWLPLNREYAPLGARRAESIDYEAHAGRAWWFETDPREITGAWRKIGRQPYVYIEHEMVSIGAFEAYLARVGRLLAATGENVAVYAGALTALWRLSHA